MTNYPDNDNEPIIQDLTDLYAAPVPDLTFQRPAVAARRERGFGFRLAGAAAGVVAVALAAVVVAPGLFGGGTQAVDAAEVLQRTSEVTQSNAPAAGSASYHLVATSQFHAADDVFTTETTYGSPGRYRTEQRSADGYAFGQVVNGDDAWIYQVLDGETYAVHGPATALGVDLSGQSLGGGASLAEVMGQYETWGCQSAAQAGEGTVAGRSVYVIEVTTDPANCPTSVEREKAAFMAGSVLTLWVDQETFLTLKTEQTDVDGTASYTYEVSQIEVGGDAGGDTFAYEAPAGVTVTEATDINSAKEALSQGSDSSEAPPAPEPDVQIDKQ